jgi:hypothetical protein
MMWNAMNVKPESGRRIVCLFDDGSGANVFLTHDGGRLDEHGVEDSYDGYNRWAYLPDDFRLWFEDDEPLTAGKSQ